LVGSVVETRVASSGGAATGPRADGEAPGLTRPASLLPIRRAPSIWRHRFRVLSSIRVEPNVGSPMQVPACSAGWDSAGATPSPETSVWPWFRRKLSA